MKKIIRIPAYGKSMYPFFLSGDILFIQPISLKKIQVNDFITFVEKNVFITHRVIYIPSHKKYILTKGDTNKLPDKRIFPKNIIGKVIKIQRDGKIFSPDALYQLQSVLYFNEIKKVTSLFRRNAINFVFLKGLPLHLYVEKKIPQRLYADCDILVDKADIPICISLLKQHGYTMKGASTKIPKFLQTYPPEFDMTKKINGFPVTFDIHTEVCFMIKQFFRDVSPFYSEDLLLNLGKQFLSNKRTITIERSRFALLGKEDLVLYLALHLFSHNLKGYHHYETLKTIFLKETLNYEILAKNIKDFKLENYVFMTFLLLKKYYRLSFPLSFMETIQPKKKTLSYMQKNILNTNIFSEEGKMTRGEEKFRHIFFLSPNTIIKKMTIIFSIPILYSIAWVFLKKIHYQFIFLKGFSRQYGNFLPVKAMKKRSA